MDVHPSMLKTFSLHVEGEPDDRWWHSIEAYGQIEMAALLATLFWPEFIEAEGCVVLREQYNAAQLTEWLRYYDGDRSATEAMVNHAHLTDLFLNDPQRDATALELWEYLGRTLSRTWAVALRDAYPDRHFTVEYDDDREGNGPVVTFWQER